VTGASANGLTRQLAAFVAGARFEHLSAKTVRVTRLSLLDAVGVTLAASGMGEGVAAFADVARETGGRPEAAVIGFGFHTSMLGAVIANGAGAHALDYEDAYDGAPVHPNAACAPVALAVGQAMNASGPAILTALAVGCDLVCRLGLALGVNPDDAGWYPPPILSTFGAAATAANLLELDTDQTAAALALALNQATATAQFKTDPSSTLRAVRDAFPAHAGLLAALLARRGVRGFDGVFEGRAGLFAQFSQGRYDPNALTDGLGERFHGDRLSFKLWPSCRGTHAFIEAALLLRTQEGLSPHDIVEIIMTGGPVQRMLAEPPAQKRAPRTAIDAKFSLPFTTAAALLHGRIDLDSFSSERLADAKVLALAARSRFEVDQNATIREAAAGRLELRLRDGRSLSVHVPHPLGAPQNPVEDAGLIDKFLDCARRSAAPLEAGGAIKIAEVLLGLDEVAAPAPILASLSGCGLD
jgi:2-methylcitrate dehydratase PrpD